MSNSLGKLFQITSFGESHGDCVGVVIDGVPAGLAINVDEIQAEVDKRKSRAKAHATPRCEDDRIEIFSGILNNFTTGAPICLVIWNKNIDSSEYERTRSKIRPGHADFTGFVKYGGFNDFRGGGRFSGRITAGHVMAGAIARKLISTIGIEVIGYTAELGGIVAKLPKTKDIRQNISQSDVNCPDLTATKKMLALIQQAAEEGDSLGGVVECLGLNLPVGLGEPVFDTLEGELAKAMFAIPAVKGVEFGAGFEASRLRGSKNNDPFSIQANHIRTTSNNCGGVLGGISDGMPLQFRVAVKPTPSISLSQPTVNIDTMTNTSLEIRGRHDTCIVPRAVSVVEAMTCIVLADLALRAGMIPRVIKQ
ncbi:MAG: chorismate synthase [Dehalococcoides mccartyi]|jgi:chorismate synthase|uniref:Chorismate synthase n=2 Tax=root TaxID=1 RepID=A0A0V8M4P4_9CHLR|nr:MULTISPECIES: chorismate synthase [Dehalococcoides]AII59148.1 chorismate synthase [Dehalococcoides mccartyi CG4]AQU02847.1 chorismate synthase [Dehalococcoides mccartyi]AQU04175.1 chorismate synthase [Dehalococcoides mccartyi]KSV18726.1 chorismate synthase [Dehalococcoides mccartyi]MBF4482619.1 chorismate synthase [Dehalococcoides mccartyi]